MGFRYHARAKALALGLDGYARNLPDGRVEVLACGTLESVERLCAWLERGPTAARVIERVCEEVTASRDTGFRIA